MSNATKTAIVAFALGGVLVVPAVAAGPVAFTPHRAVYDLTIDPAHAGADVIPIYGRMVMELAGACDGYTSAVRFVTQTTNDRGRIEVTDTRSTSLETADGFFKFEDKTFTNNRLADWAEGTVTRGPDNSVGILAHPSNKTFSLSPDVVFPVEQLRTIIEAASEGERFLSLDVYDGSNGGETVYATATVIGNEITDGGASDTEPVLAVGLGGLRGWPTTISYFEKRSADATPSFVMSFVLYENGIGRSLKIDRGDVVLVGSLTHLELLPAPTCIAE